MVVAERDDEKLAMSESAAQKAGQTVLASDGLIAATARRHGLHVMTRNATDFTPMGVLLLNP